MNVLGMEDMNENNKEIFNFFKQLNIEDVEKLVVIPQRISAYHHTKFRFITKNGIKLVFHYVRNKIISDVHVVKVRDNLFLDIQYKHQKWIDHIWEQFVEHFNLRIRLLFINETTPWKWNTEFIY